ncbi:MAG: sugar ABC transporter permease [Firmicutes bacterium]|nr:sugar ABC transporter permease [Bacillota bacterium]
MLMNEKLELKQRGRIYRIINSIFKCPYVLIAPALITCLVLTIYPLCFGAYLSVHKWDPLSGRKKFVGWDNFKYLIESEDFHKALTNTIIYMLVILFVGLALKVILGVFLNKRTPGHNLVQTVIFTPHIIASVSVSVIFMWLMDPAHGILNMALNAVGLPTSNWYLSKDTALMSVLIVAIWQSCGQGVLVVIAGLRSIPEYIYEAAKLDKSTPVKTFFKITIPLLSPTLLYMVVTTTASAFTSFDIVKMMTDGGPDNATNLIAYYVYQQGIMFMQYGRAMAAGVVLFVFTATLSAINFFVLDRKVYYQ